MAKPMIVIALACILAPAIGHAQESDTLLDDPGCSEKAMRPQKCFSYCRSKSGTRP